MRNMSVELLVYVVCGLFVAAITGREIALSEQFSAINYADADSAGYRHCAYWKLADGTHLHSECDPYNMDRCGVPAKYDYKCCAGFEEDQKTFMAYARYRPAICSKVISPFDSCVETVLHSRDHSAFAPLLAAVPEFREKRSQEPYTIFAPMLRDEDNNFPQATEHVVRGRFYASDLKDGMTLETLEGQMNLYVNRYPYGVIAINCAEILEADLECRDGIIHKIRQPTGGHNGNSDLDRSSVLSLLRTNPETKSFVEDLPADLKQLLGDVSSGKRYTVLAPRTQMWDALKLRYKGEKLQKIAAAHVLSGQVCSGRLINMNNIRSTVRGDRVTIECDVDPVDEVERRAVITDCGEKRNILETDLAATNGVVHILDEPIIPLSVLTIEDLKNNEQCAQKLKITEFMKLLKECDLYVDENATYAMIVPRNEAFLWWSNYEPFKEQYKRFQVDRDYRCHVARYHVVKSNDRLNNMENLASHTAAHRTNNRGDYLYETTYFQRSPYGSQLYFHYSPISDMESHELDGTSLYFTPKINVPPEKNITDILSERPDTTITYNKTIQAKMETEHFDANAPKNLYLVTTDDGWKDPRAKPGSSKPWRPEYSMYKGEALEKYLLLHHVPLYLWGGDIGYFPENSIHHFKSSAGAELTFWRDSDGVMRIGHEEIPRDEWPKVVKWNLPARDGIVWLLDGPIKCPESICRLYVEDVDYYDMYVSACQIAQLPNEPNAAVDFRLKPTDVASRHPTLCTVVLQLSESSVTLIEA